MISEENCTICNKTAVLKIRGESIFYCKDCGDKFFSVDSLENIAKIRKSEKEALALKKFILKK